MSQCLRLAAASVSVKARKGEVDAISSCQFGVVVPRPRLPAEVMRPASVRVPAFRVENASAPLPVVKF